MSRIKRETIDRIFETAQIEEVIGEFVQLKRAGSNYKGLSPFNNEKSPSFMVSPAKQIFKDFSSGKGGSVVTFLMELESYTYPEALRWLAKKYNIEIEEEKEERSPEQEQLHNEREAVYLISEFAQKWYADQLFSEEGKRIGLSYFRERGFTDETIAKFGLGYAPLKKDAFATEALAKAYNAEVLLASGISLQREDGGWYDRFWGRVLFPIHSISGRVLGFGGRVLNSEAKTAKYLNSPENPIYHKSKILFGLFQARKDIVKQDEAYLVEGYTDVISLHQIGVENVVSSSGTSLTEDQIRLIKRYSNNVTILYDGDAAGIRASFRGIDMFLQEGVNVRVVLFPDGDDPDSYARKTSRIEFNEFIAENRTDFIRFKTGLLLDEAKDDPIKRADIIRDIVTSIALMPDEISQDVFIKESARILSMDEKVLFNELSLIKSKGQRDAVKRGAQPTMHVVEKQEVSNVPLEAKTKDSLHFEQELEVIKMLINHGNDELTPPKDAEPEEGEFIPTVAQYIISDILEDGTSFTNPRFQLVYDACLEHLQTHDSAPEPTWYVRQENEDLAQINAEILTDEVLSKNWEKRGIFVVTPVDRIAQHTEQVVLRFKNAKLKTRLEEVRKSLENELPEEESKKLMEEFKSLNAIRQAINTKLNRVV